VDELNRVMQVRAKVLERFGERTIPVNSPKATIEDVLVPAYLMHRYQAEAAAKVVGGVEYTYALRGDGQQATKPVAGAEQRRALDALLKTLSANALALREELLREIPPRPPGFPRTRENFRGRTGVTFDGLSPVEAAANLVLGLVFDGQRAARLVEQNARMSDQPGLSEVIDRVFGATWGTPRLPGWNGQVQNAVDYAALRQFLMLAADESTAEQARAVARTALDDLAAKWKTKLGQEPARRAQYAYGIALITKFRENPKEFAPEPGPEPPPGQPIGDTACDWDLPLDFQWRLPPQ
jgi:hypothetical protein